MTLPSHKECLQLAYPKPEPKPTPEPAPGDGTASDGAGGDPNDTWPDGPTQTTREERVARKGASSVGFIFKESEALCGLDVAPLIHSGAIEEIVASLDESIKRLSKYRTLLLNGVKPRVERKTPERAERERHPATRAGESARKAEALLLKAISSTYPEEAASFLTKSAAIIREYAFVVKVETD